VHPCSTFRNVGFPAARDAVTAYVPPRWSWWLRERLPRVLNKTPSLGVADLDGVVYQIWKPAAGPGGVRRRVVALLELMPIGGDLGCRQKQLDALASLGRPVFIVESNAACSRWRVHAYPEGRLVLDGGEREFASWLAALAEVRR
jgi:hypothetical protein